MTTRKYRVPLQDMVLTTSARAIPGPDPAELFHVQGISGPAGPGGPLTILHVTGSTVAHGECEFSCLVDWTTLAPLMASMEEVVSTWTPEYRARYAARVDQARMTHRETADEIGTTLEKINEEDGQ